MSERSLIEQLKAEVRTCDQCGLEIRHPFVERCPRCCAALPKLPVMCPGCIHRFICPVREMVDRAAAPQSGSENPVATKP